MTVILPTDEIEYGSAENAAAPSATTIPTFDAGQLTEDVRVQFPL